jgi:flagellar M-ring protein FliF
VGSVRRISVAVLINDRPAAGKGANAKPQPMSAQQLAQVRQLVQDAIGFDAKRGDQVSVVSMPFGAAAQTQEAALPLWRSPAIWDSVRGAVPYVLALIFGLLIYRAVRRLATPAARGEAEQAEEEEREQGVRGSGSGAAPGELAPEVVHLSNTFENDAAVSRELAKQDPRRAAQVVKEWLADGQ